MKKILALLLTALLLLGLSATALAETVDTSTWRSTEDDGKFTFTKNYVKDTSSKREAAKFPAEELAFDVAFVSGPISDNAPMIYVNAASNATTSSSTSFDITVHTPVYSKVGKYTYTITERSGSAQGVTYDTAAINVAVLVTYDYEHEKLAVNAGVEKADADATKNDTLYNVYKLGGNPYGDPATAALTVKKEVSGNLGDQSKVFTINVKLTTESGKKVYSDITVSGGSEAGNSQTIAGDGWSEKTVTVYLKHDETVSFYNIPDGVRYHVVEDSTHTTGDINSAEGYTATYENQSGTIAENETKAAVVKNEKETTIYTGITLDTLPYIVALAVVAVGAVLLIARRRRREDD